MTVKQVAQYLRVSEISVRRLLTTGKLKAQFTRMGQTRRWNISQADITRYLHDIPQCFCTYKLAKHYNPNYPNHAPTCPLFKVKKTK